MKRVQMDHDTFVPMGEKIHEYQINGDVFEYYRVFDDLISAILRLEGLDSIMRNCSSFCFGLSKVLRLSRPMMSDGKLY